MGFLFGLLKVLVVLTFCFGVIGGFSYMYYKHAEHLEKKFGVRIFDL